MTLDEIGKRCEKLLGLKVVIDECPSRRCAYCRGGGKYYNIGGLEYALIPFVVLLLFAMGVSDQGFLINLIFWGITGIAAVMLSFAFISANNEMNELMKKDDEKSEIKEIKPISGGN